MSDATKVQLRNVVAHLCAFGVAGYFLWAASSKIIEPRQFVIDIRNYKMMPEQLLHLIALYLPWLEVCAAVALAIPATRRAGAFLIAAQLVMFIVAISYAALWMGYDIKCGCTGKDSSMAGWWTIALDSGLLLATILAAYLPTKLSSSV